MAFVNWIDNTLCLFLINFTENVENWFDSNGKEWFFIRMMKPNSYILCNFLETMFLMRNSDIVLVFVEYDWLLFKFSLIIIVYFDFDV